MKNSLPSVSFTLPLIATLTVLMTPNMWAFDASRNFPTPVGYPRTQLNSDTVYLEIASDPTG